MVHLVGKVGVEPTRSIEHMILSHACLPIPALPRQRDYKRGENGRQ
jgi:hypothetical protein